MIRIINDECIEEFFVHSYENKAIKVLECLSNDDLAIINNIFDSTERDIGFTLWYKIDIITKSKIANVYYEWLGVTDIKFPRIDFSGKRELTNKHYPPVPNGSNLLYYKDLYKSFDSIWSHVKSYYEYRICNVIEFNKILSVVANILNHSGVYVQYPTFKYHQLLPCIIIVNGKKFCDKIVDDPDLVHECINKIDFNRIPLRIINLL